MLKEHDNADSLIVTTVTTSLQRLENILKTAVKAETRWNNYAAARAAVLRLSRTPEPYQS